MTRITPHADLPLESVLQRLTEAAARPFEEARPIPPAVHHSPAFFAHERDRVFTKEWICIGRADEVAAPGDYLTYEVADVPVFATRLADGSVKAFVNACAHRFARLLSEEKGTAEKIVCPYHAWTYDGSGCLLRAPYMDLKEGFDLAAHRLRELKTEIWEGFLFVTLSDNPAKFLAEALAPLHENVVRRFAMGNYRAVLRETMIWNANWKNLIENFTESYHVPIAHGQSFAQHQKRIKDYVCGEESDHFGYHHAPQPAETGPGAAHPSNTRLEGEWRRMMVDFCVFPGLLVTLMPDYLWYITVQPITLDRMRATWGVAVPPEILDDVSEADYPAWLAEMKKFIDIANSEDKPLVEALFKGSASPLLPAGTLHPIERNLWQFTRYLARVCGEER